MLLSAHAEVRLIHPNSQRIPVRDENPGANVKFPSTFKEEAGLDILLNHDTSLPAATLGCARYDILEVVITPDAVTSRAVTWFHYPNIT
jgi:hypothetical protein